MTNQPSLAILIDCWDNLAEQLPQCIISFLDSTDSIQSVVLATYNCKQFKNKHWFQKYVDIFTKDQPLRKIKDLWHVHSVFNHGNREYPEENTHPLVLNYINADKIQCSMTWLWELEYYLSIHPEIKNIYVLGTAWEQCVKIRPLGYENLTELSGINILTDTNCVLTMDNSTPDLTADSNWEHVTGTIWKYKYE